MRRSAITGLSAIGVAVTLVAGISAVSYAANGGTMIIGQLNQGANKTTIERTGGGPALGIRVSNPAQPPFTTNATGKVTNLYADRAANANELEGSTKAEILSAARTVRGYTFRDSQVSRASNTTYTLTRIPHGIYLVTVGATVVLSTKTNWTTTPPSVNEFRCLVYDSGSQARPLMATSTSFDTTGTASVHGSAVIAVTGDEAWKLTCRTTSGDGWAAFALGYPLERPQVSFIKLQGNYTLNLS